MVKVHIAQMCNSWEINQNLILLINSTIFVLFRVFFYYFCFNSFSILPFSMKKR